MRIYRVRQARPDLFNNTDFVVWISTYSLDLLFQPAYRNVYRDVTARIGWQRSQHCHPVLTRQKRFFTGVSHLPELVFALLIKIKEVYLAKLKENI